MLLNDDFIPVNCDYDEMICLPVYDMDDIRFQLITDFPTTQTPGGQPVTNVIVAMPCEGQTTPADVFDILFSEPQIEGGAAFVFNGFVQLQTTVNHGLSTGDLIFISGDYVSGTDMRGFQRVKFTSADSDDLSLDLPTNGIVSGAFKIQKAGTPAIIASSGTSIGGGEYVWDFSVSNVDIPEGMDCFRFCLYKISLIINSGGAEPQFHSGQFLGTTNCFNRVTDLCDTSLIEYKFYEDAMSFYGSPSRNRIRLPLHLSRPQYPGDENSYQTSDGRWLKLSERVNKEWNLETDWLPDAVHEKIRIALSADFIIIWNRNENLALEGLYRSEEYNLEWNEDVDYPLTKAKTTVKKRVLEASLNSNCV